MARAVLKRCYNWQRCNEKHREVEGAYFCRVGSAPVLREDPPPVSARDFLKMTGDEGIARAFDIPEEFLQSSVPMPELSEWQQYMKKKRELDDKALREKIRDTIEQQLGHPIEESKIEADTKTLARTYHIDPAHNGASEPMVRLYMDGKFVGLVTQWEWDAHKGQTEYSRESQERIFGKDRKQ